MSLPDFERAAKALGKDPEKAFEYLKSAFKNLGLNFVNVNEAKKSFFSFFSKAESMLGNGIEETEIQVKGKHMQGVVILCFSYTYSTFKMSILSSAFNNELEMAGITSDIIFPIGSVRRIRKQVKAHTGISLDDPDSIPVKTILISTIIVILFVAIIMIVKGFGYL